MRKVSIGVFAYNEERTIGQTLDALVKQRCRESEILEILVISSASTDATDAVVNGMAARDRRIRLIRENERRGKSAAVNLYLARKSPEAAVAILVSADLIPAPDAVEQLTLPFNDATVGMAGGRPVPVNDADRFLGFVVQLQWDLHHQISLSRPKCGEMVAIRADLTPAIPEVSAVDEASLEAIAVTKGLRLRYVPEAVFRNRGPQTLGEFVAQRRRIACGHRWLKRTTGHRVATGSALVIMRSLLKKLRFRPIEWVWIAGAVALEGSCRLLGALDLLLRRNPHQAWRVLPTTKEAFTLRDESC